MFYSVCFSISMFFSVSRHIPCSTVCLYNFPSFSVVLAKSHVLQCVFLIFYVFQHISPYTRFYSVRFSFSTFFSVSVNIHGYPECVSHLTEFSVFLLYTKSNTMRFSFSMFLSGSAIYHVIECAFLIFHVFQCFSPYSMQKLVYGEKR